MVTLLFCKRLSYLNILSGSMYDLHKSIECLRSLRWINLLKDFTRKMSIIHKKLKGESPFTCVCMILGGKYMAVLIYAVSNKTVTRPHM